MSSALFGRSFSLDGERDPLDGEWVDVDGLGVCVYDRAADCWRRPGEIAHGGRSYRVLDCEPARFLPVIERSRLGWLRRVEGWGYGSKRPRPKRPQDVRGLPVLDIHAVTERLAPVQTIVTFELPTNGRSTRHAVVAYPGATVDDTVERAVALRRSYSRSRGPVETYTAQFGIPRTFPLSLDRWTVSTFALATLARSQSVVPTRVLRGRVGHKVRFLILRRDGYRCRICGSTAGDGVRLHVDHIVALANEGTNDLDNLWTLCEPCNLGKGTLDL